MHPWTCPCPAWPSPGPETPPTREERLQVSVTIPAKLRLHHRWSHPQLDLPLQVSLRIMLAALLITLSYLSLHTLGIHGQVTGENLLLQQREHLWRGGNPGPDSSKIPPRDASLGCHLLNSLPLRNLHPCREPQVPIPSPRTPLPPTGPPVTLLLSYPPLSGSLQLSLVTSHLPPWPSLHTLLRLPVYDLPTAPPRPGLDLLSTPTRGWRMQASRVGED